MADVATNQPKHSTEIVDYVQLSNNQFAIVLRCCGEHEHRHTMDALVINDPEKLAASIEWAHRETAKNHEAALQWQQRLEAAKGQKVEHP